MFECEEDYHYHLMFDCQYVNIQCLQCKESYCRHKFKLPSHKCYFQKGQTIDSSSEINFLKEIIREKDLEIYKLNELYSTKDLLTDKKQKNIQGNFKCLQCGRFTIEPSNLFFCKNTDCLSRKKEMESPRQMSKS